MDNQQKCIIQHMEFNSMLYATWMRGGFGAEWIHVYVWVSPFTVHLKQSQHCY